MIIENWVELLEEGIWNQKCKHGHLIPGHSVYCHSANPESPRKCHRTWFTGGETKDEDCPYYEENKLTHLKSKLL